MNKSKFLKKSLAMILAVMLVVAMIPLGASAAKSLDLLDGGVFQSLTADKGDLSGSGTSFENAIPYSVSDSANESLAVKLMAGTGYTTVNYTVTKADGTDDAEATGLTMTVPVTAKKVSFYAVNADGDKKSATHTITFNKPAPSTDTTVTAAKLGGKYVGDISGTTITFELPWGYTGDMTVALTLKDHPADTNGEAIPVTATASLAAPVVKKVESQYGNFTNYTIVAKEMTGLTKLTIANVSAVLDEETGEYNVTLPEDTDLSKEVAITYTVASNGVKVTKAELSTVGEIKSGNKYTVAEGKYTLTLTSSENTTKTYTVNVAKARSKDASISAFAATAVIVDGDGTEYTEAGVVNGQDLTVELPYNSDLEHVKVKFTVADGATVKVSDVAHTDASQYNLKDGVKLVVEVTAADGQTVKYYRLSATTAASPYGTPAITGAKLTIDDDEYVGVISGKTITFTVPYATLATDVTGGTFAWTKSFATAFITPADPHIVWGADVFENGGEVGIKSDGGDEVYYTVTVAKAAAKTGKTLSSLSLSTATVGENVTADNTYKATVSSSKVTVSLPYSYQTKLNPTFVPTFELPEGAALYVSIAGGNLTAVTSGYDEDSDAANYTVSRSDLFAVNGDGEFTSKIVVADETAKLAIATAGTVSLAALDADPYKGHVTVYDVAANYAAAQTGHTLTALTADDGLVSSKVSGNTVEITVPASYVTKGIAFYADYTASKLAEVKAGSAVLPETVPAASGAEGELKVVKNGDALELHVNDGSNSWTKVSQIVVTAEDENNNTIYTVTVVAAPARTEALVTSVKVNNTYGVINDTAKTVEVTLPFNSDLTLVTLECEVSELATPTVTGLDAPTTIDGVDYYDVSEGFKISVKSEDEKTTNVYTVTVKALDKFSDVPAGAYYYDYVYKAAEESIVSGYPDGTFKPNNNVTRGEFVSMVTRMLGVDTSSYTTTTFSDVPADYFGLKAIAYCSEAGIISGVGNGKFNPNAPITRQDAAVVVAKALKLSLTASTTSFADDAKVSSYAKKYVAACAKAELIKGVGGNNYSPLANIKRCDAAIILVKSLDK